MQERTGTKDVFRGGKNTVCCRKGGGTDLFKITIISLGAMDVSFSINFLMKHNFIWLVSKFEGENVECCVTLWKMRVFVFLVPLQRNRI